MKVYEGVEVELHSLLTSLLGEVIMKMRNDKGLNSIPGVPLCLEQSLIKKHSE
jgi:hypothetical protein